MKTRLLISVISGFIVLTSMVLFSLYQNSNNSLVLDYDEIEYDDLITRKSNVGSNVAIKQNPSKICFEISSEEFKDFPDSLKESMIEAKSEILTSEQIEDPVRDYLSEGRLYYSGHGESIKPKEALEFLQKYDFKVEKETTNHNISKIEDKSYSFTCDILFEENQYKIVFDFEPIYPSWENFVVINITKNELGVPIIKDPEIDVFHTFNATVIFENNLDHEVSISRKGNTIKQGGLSFDKIVIPKGKSWPYMLRTWYLNEEGSTNYRSFPFDYEIQPGNLVGKIMVHSYPRCMSENEIKSLYSQVDVFPKFPRYVPEGYSFECGIHNMNSIVRWTYWNDDLREKYDDQVGGSFQFEFFSNGGIAIDYSDGYVLNGWIETPNYDKYQKANENAQHPKAKSLTVAGEPAVMTTEYLWVKGDQISYNKLQVFLDDEIRIAVSSGLSEEELIRIAESLFT